MWGFIPGLWDHELNQRQALSLLSHPGAPLVDFFSLMTLNVCHHYLLASMTSHKEAINRIKDPLYVMNYFPLAASKSLVYLAFVELL